MTDTTFTPESLRDVACAYLVLFNASRAVDARTRVLNQMYKFYADNALTPPMSAGMPANYRNGRGRIQDCPYWRKLNNWQ